MKRLTLISLAAATALASSQLFAAPVAIGPGNGNEQSLQQILNGITVSTSSCDGTNPGDCSSSIDVNTDQTNLSYASVDASGGSFSQIVIELAGNAMTNSMGIFDAANRNNKVQFFGGPAGQGYKSLLEIDKDGSVYVNTYDANHNQVGTTQHGQFAAGNHFGFYLDAANDNTFYSDASLNEDGHAHFVAFQGNGKDMLQINNSGEGLFTKDEYIFGWEDGMLNNGSDGDYNDFVGIIESVSPVPEPGTVGIFGFGLLGLTGLVSLRRRRSQTHSLTATE